MGATSFHHQPQIIQLRDWIELLAAGKCLWGPRIESDFSIGGAIVFGE